MYPRTNRIRSLKIRHSACIDHVAEWMRSNRLQWNAAKTEVLWSTTSRRLHQMPQSVLRVGVDRTRPPRHRWNLGMFIGIFTTTLYPTISAVNRSPNNTVERGAKYSHYGASLKEEQSIMSRNELPPIHRYHKISIQGGQYVVYGLVRKIGAPNRVAESRVSWRKPMK